MTDIVDADQRSRALDPTKSYICEAPAGSGKTGLLTQRLLTLLSRVRKPEEILAITFTRKAAGEMRDRVIRSLEKGISTPEPESQHESLTWRLATAVLEKDKYYGWDIIHNPGRLQIKTFDSLCASLASTLPLHSSFAASPHVVEDVEVIYLETARMFLNTLERDAPWSDSLAGVLRLLDNNTEKLEKLLVKMLSQREAWLPILGRGADRNTVLRVLESNLQNVRKETITRLKKAIPIHLCRAWIEYAVFAAANTRQQNIQSPILSCLNFDIDKNTLPNAEGEGVDQWLGMISMVLTLSGDWRKSLDRRIGFPQGEGQDEKQRFREKKTQALEFIQALAAQPQLKDRLLEVRQLPSACYGTDQSELLSAIIDILPALSAHLSLVFQEKGQVDFPEVSIRARLALGDLHSPSELSFALDYKIQHILVDEFQDTSPSQIDLLTSLTAGWEPDDSRTVFCVGDAMQSVYGFRDANVGLFLKCIENGLGGISLTPLRLSTNFRAQAGLVKWINSVFSSAFPQLNDISVGAVRYSPSQAARKRLPRRAVCLHGFAEGTTNFDEARTVLEIIRKTRMDKPNASIAILVRNRNHAAHITSLLDETGLKYRAVDLHPLTDHVIVQDLMALTHALLRPQDRIAWLSVFRAPWCGLGLVDLEAIANFRARDIDLLTLFQQACSTVELQGEYNKNTHSGSGEFNQPDFFITGEAQQSDQPFRLLTEDGQARMRRVLPVLRSAIGQSQRKPLRQWVRGVWVKLGGPACLKEPSETKNAELFFSLLESLDESTILPTHDSLQRAVKKLYAVSGSDGDDNLHIMTIHKAKGLEFDTVIVPSLHRSPRPPQHELLRWYERVTQNGETQLLMSPIPSSGKSEDPVYSHLAVQDKRRESHESCRLLYVACTRAKERLHLLASVKSDDKDTLRLRPPAKSSLLFSVWEAVQTRINVYRKENESPARSEIEKPKVLQRLHSQWALPSLPATDTLAQYVPYHDHQNKRDDFRWRNNTPRVVGTLVHRLLKEVDGSRLRNWQEEIPEHERDLWKSLLIYLGVQSYRLDDALARTCAILKHIADNTELHWIFSDDLEQRHTEYSLTLASSQGVEHYVIDLLLVYNNITWIIDYKTGQPDEDESTEAFLAKELQIYRKIMCRYRSAVISLGYQNVKLALYFPLINRWVEYNNE